MTATTVSIKTEYRDGILIPVPLAALASVLMGTFAVVDADGFAVSSADVGAANQKCLGVWESDAENPHASGEVCGVVRRNKHFLVNNSSSDPVTQADIGQVVYAADNQTIAKTDSAGTFPKVGTFLGFDLENPTSVWVEIV